MPEASAASRDPEHIAVSKSKGMKIDWADGHRSEYTCAYLRDECPCAGCTGAHGTPPERSSYAQPAANPFPMFQPKLKMTEVEEVGSYAVRIAWSDGHNAGIYSWDYLRGICPCPECKPVRV
jgi:DUF971 family protein